MATHLTGYELTQTESQRKTKILNAKQRTWDLYFLKLAEAVSVKSCDTSMKVGCIIVGPDNEIRTTGYNGFPRSVEPNKDRLERPVKYIFTEHAERNSIYNAARYGVSLQGCTAYIACTPREKGGKAPCCDCTRALIQAGISRIVQWNTPDVSEKDATRTWLENIKYSYEMLRETNMRLSYINE